MSDKYAEYIRLIVGVNKQNQSSLEAAPVQTVDSAIRGIAFMNADGSVGSASGQPGVTKPGSFGTFNTTDVNNAGNNTDSNSYSNVSTVLSSGRIGDQINGLNNLKDCNTGVGVDVRTRGDGKFAPPPNWDSSTTPSATNPLRWDLGQDWISDSGPPVFGTSPATCAAEVVAILGAGWSFDAFVTPSTIGSGAPFVAHYSKPPTSSAYFSFVQQSCTPKDGSVICPTHNVIKWPATGRMQLARNLDGTFKYSPNQAGADLITAFTDNKHTQLDLCMDDGSGRKVGIKPTSDGGYMLYEKNATTGDPMGRVEIMDANSKIVAFTNPIDMVFLEVSH